MSDQGSLFAGPVKPPRPETSSEAFDSIADRLVGLEKIIVREVLRSGGLTCDEIEVRLNLRHQTASARVNSLMKRGLLQDSGARRPTRSGRNAAVWVRGR